MKKLTTLLLTLLMVFTLIGCNSKKEEPTPTIEEPVVEKQEEEVKQEEPVLVEETKEEKEETTTKEEVKTKDIVDPSIYDYWVVVYDQYGNEISRTTAHYGTIVKDPDGKDVKVLTNTYFHTTVNYPSSNKGGGSSEPQGPTIPMPAKGDIITLNNHDNMPFRVLKTNGTEAFVVGLFSINNNQSYWATGFDGELQHINYLGEDGSQHKHISYGNSSLDKLLENTWYGLGLEYTVQDLTLKNAIVAKEIKQYQYAYATIAEINAFELDKGYPPYIDYLSEINYEKSGRSYTYRLFYDLSYNPSNVTNNTISRHVYALDCSDILEYLGKKDITGNDIFEIFKLSNSIQKYVLLRSAWAGDEDGGVMYIDTKNKPFDGTNYNQFCSVYPAFYIDLNYEGIEWAEVIEE